MRIVKRGGLPFVGHGSRILPLGIIPKEKPATPNEPKEEGTPQQSNGEAPQPALTVDPVLKPVF